MYSPAAFIVAAVIGALPVQLAQSHHIQEHEADSTPSDEAPIEVLINPEARVSVSRNERLPLPMAACGQVMNVPVTIVNQAFLTAPLEVRLADPRPRGVVLAFSSRPLLGVSTEHRTLHITVVNPDLVDVTLAFRTRNNIPDLGGRDRIHLLLQCHSG